jgi:hypothetical protein
MTRIVKWLDRNIWVALILLFLIVEVAFGIWSVTSKAPVLLAAASPTVRQQVYASLAGSSSALLVIALAVVAILAAFDPRPASPGRPAAEERQQTRARTTLVGSLLMASFFLLVILVTATIALAVDSQQAGNAAIAVLIEGASLASVLGLLMGGVGLALVIAERSR